MASSSRSSTEQLPPSSQEQATDPRPSKLSHQHRLLLVPLLAAARSSNPEVALRVLTSWASSDSGLSNLVSDDNLLPDVLRFVQSLPPPEYLVLSLKLLRSLVAGETANQSAFIDFDGDGVVSAVLISAGLYPDPDPAIIGAGLQVLAVVSQAGEPHRLAIWDGFFPTLFLALARVRSREVSDPLCMILYTCCYRIPALFAQLLAEEGIAIVAEIVKTVSLVGYEGGDWFKRILSMICLDEGGQLNFLFLRLHRIRGPDADYKGKAVVVDDSFSSEQAYLLATVVEIFREGMKDARTASVDFALCVLGILDDSAAAYVLDHVSGGKCGHFPTGDASIDVLGYSLTILKHLCDSAASEEEEDDVVSSLLSRGLMETLLRLLRELEGIPSATRREATTTTLCPYIGFRRDVVATIGSCAYRRKHVQDRIRKCDGILLLLQQCHVVDDDDNPFLREWGIWTMRNLLEGNVENQNVLGELVIQGIVHVPDELWGRGVTVEVDRKSGRAWIVNASSSSSSSGSTKIKLD
ncbi:unnamed protein product [Linum tenue]|uniref:Ataxin-10 domain-containing protein n=1 Tax=Linum tenue TaxID=586396 RepID=A0AAV0IJX8_9ROSI|nr:unnamed protein product [Linum tenue]